MKSSNIRNSIRELGVPYRLLFVSGVLSDIGGFSTVTALQVHISKLTGGNASFMGLISVATLLPMIIAAPIGGVWAERGNRRTIMVLNDLIRIPLVLLMATTQSVPLLLLLHAGICACTALFMPSRQSLIPELVPSEHLLFANSLSGGVISTETIYRFVYAQIRRHNDYRWRHYLPRADCVAYGACQAELLTRQTTPQNARLIQDSADWARALMVQGEPMVHRMPGRMGWELRLVVQGGLRILDKVDALQGGSLHTRPRLHAPDWIVMLARAATSEALLPHLLAIGWQALCVRADVQRCCAGPPL